jgi:hypothetical protein
MTGEREKTGVFCPQPSPLPYQSALHHGHMKLCDHPPKSTIPLCTTRLWFAPGWLLCIGSLPTRMMQRYCWYERFCSTFCRLDLGFKHPFDFRFSLRCGVVSERVSVPVPSFDSGSVFQHPHGTWHLHGIGQLRVSSVPCDCLLGHLPQLLARTKHARVYVPHATTTELPPPCLLW